MQYFQVAGKDQKTSNRFSGKKNIYLHEQTLKRTSTSLTNSKYNLNYIKNLKLGNNHLIKLLPKVMRYQVSGLVSLKIIIRRAES